MHPQVTFFYLTVIYICYYVSLLCILQNIQKLEIKRYKNKYEGILIQLTLEHHSVNHAGPLTLRFFSVSTHYTIRSWLNLHIQRANCKVTCGFLTVWRSVHWPPCSRISCNSVSPSVIVCAHFGDHCWGVGDSNLIIIPSPCPVVYHGGKRDERPEGGVCLWSIPCLPPLLW